MCGRFTQSKTMEEILKHIQLKQLLKVKPRYNIAPSQEVTCVRNASGNGSKDRECVLLRWGLIPYWAKDPSIGNRLINARAETVTEKPAFRKAFRFQRCLVLADGFYEWKREGKRKQPYYFCFRDHRLFAFAGLWDKWENQQHTIIETCAILTTKPNAVMEPIHNRMPVILDEKDYDLWLDSKVQGGPVLHGLLRTHPGDEMLASPVSTHVNNPLFDDPACLD